MADSTCLVNLNRFAMPQFEAFGRTREVYQREWREWPVEIPEQRVIGIRPCRITSR